MQLFCEMQVIFMVDLNSFDTVNPYCKANVTKGLLSCFKRGFFVTCSQNFDFLGALKDCEDKRP